MSKIYFDNDISHPEGFSSAENHSWLARLVGAASVHIDPAIWDRLRKEAEIEVLKYRTPVAQVPRKEPVDAPTHSS